MKETPSGKPYCLLAERDGLRRTLEVHPAVFVALWDMMDHGRCGDVQVHFNAGAMQGNVEVRTVYRDREEKIKRLQPVASVK